MLLLAAIVVPVGNNSDQIHNTSIQAAYIEIIKIVNKKKDPHQIWTTF